MSEESIRDEIEGDLRESTSGRVIYLEGKTDLDFFFALLGRRIPGGDSSKGVALQGTLVKDCGGGYTGVRSRLDVAAKHRLPGVIVGVVDGDGLPYAELAGNFDAPHAGPLFRWKAYCIENLIAKTGWPTAWGSEPDWPAELSRYGPYVALNRIGSEIRSIIEEMGLAGYVHPTLSDPLKTEADFRAILEVGRARILSYSVVRRFEEELAFYLEAIRSRPDDVHVLLNGKRFIRQHLVPKLTRLRPDRCDSDWINHAVSVGGLPEIRDWWERVTGSPP